MFPRPLIALLALAILCGPSTARTFTNTEGRSIEADIVRATGETVTQLKEQ